MIPFESVWKCILYNDPGLSIPHTGGHLFLRQLVAAVPMFTMLSPSLALQGTAQAMLCLAPSTGAQYYEQYPPMA